MSVKSIVNVQKFDLMRVIRIKHREFVVEFFERMR